MKTRTPVAALGREGVLALRHFEDRRIGRVGDAEPGRSARQKDDHTRERGFDRPVTLVAADVIEEQRQRPSRRRALLRPVGMTADAPAPPSAVECRRAGPRRASRPPLHGPIEGLDVVDRRSVGAERLATLRGDERGASSDTGRRSDVRRRDARTRARGRGHGPQGCTSDLTGREGAERRTRMRVERRTRSVSASAVSQSQARARVLMRCSRQL